MQELVAKKMIMSTSKEQDQEEDQAEDDQDAALPGFRFHPTDEELVGFYLRRKVDKKPISIELIKQIDIYKYDPWDLPKVGNVGDKEWYFFCIRGRKYRNSVRPNRVTGSGFWKATGIDKPIYATKEPHDCVGLKKSLVYYRGSAGKGNKTDWMMHEFRLPPNPRSANSNFAPAKLNDSSDNVAHLEAEVWTLCRIFKRIPSYKKYSNMIPTDHKNAKENSITPRKSSPILSSISSPAADSSSKTCSLETDYGDPYHRNKRSNRIESDDHDREMSTVTRGSWFSLGQYYDTNHVPQLAPSHDHQHQAPIMLPGSNYSSFNLNPATSDRDFFTNESWDELSPVVQFAVDRHDQS